MRQPSGLSTAAAILTFYLFYFNIRDYIASQIDFFTQNSFRHLKVQLFPFKTHFEFFRYLILFWRYGRLKLIRLAFSLQRYINSKIHKSLKPQTSCTLNIELHDPKTYNPKPHSPKLYNRKPHNSKLLNPNPITLNSMTSNSIRLRSITVNLHNPKPRKSKPRWKR